MTSFTSDDGIEHFIFGKDGGKNIASKFNVELLGQIPIDIQLREQSDNGVPLMELKKNKKTFIIINEIAKKIIVKLEFKN